MPPRAQSTIHAASKKPASAGPIFIHAELSSDDLYDHGAQEGTRTPTELPAST